MYISIFSVSGQFITFKQELGPGASANPAMVGKHLVPHANIGPEVSLVSGK